MKYIGVILISLLFFACKRDEEIYTSNPPITMVAKLDSTINADVFPNPFDSTFTVNVSANFQSNIKLTIYDMTGRPILNVLGLRQPVAFISCIADAGSLQSGSYFLMVEAGNKILVKPIIKK